MNVTKALAAYNSQKANAAARGIEFKLTFKQWCDFWGDDISKRGRGHDKLQMQRIADTGPYAVGNIKKGYPRQNTTIYLRMKAKRDSEAARLRVEAALDRAMLEASADPKDEELPEHVYKLGIKSSYDERFNYRG